jgi:hypothetical protein
MTSQNTNDLHEQANAFRNLSTSLAQDDAQNLPQRDKRSIPDVKSNIAHQDQHCPPGPASTHPRAGSEIASAE